MNPPPDEDLTPTVGSPTDIAPLGLLKSKPPHERTAEELAKSVDWDAVASTPEFKQLLADKARFIVPACLFFIVYYFALLVLVGYAPHLMERRIIGVVNLAYLFALSQFFMAWIIAALYVRAAARYDEAAMQIIRKFKGPK